VGVWNAMYRIKISAMVQSFSSKAEIFALLSIKGSYMESKLLMIRDLLT